MLPQLNNAILQPKYDREKAQIGIVHLGPGAFFRAHQAWYTEQAMNLKGGNWGICAVALNSDRVKQQLSPQQNLYTLMELDQDTTVSVIGAVKEVLAFKADKDQVLSRLINKETKIVTLTITEKGYCLNAQGELDLTHPRICDDLNTPSNPQSAIGLLVLACQMRIAKGVELFSVISCDNMNNNGQKLKNAMVCFAQKTNPTLATTLSESLIAPCTMVDSITPASDDKLKQMLANNYQLDDNWPIKREKFSQWVIEDILPTDIPAWREAGVTFSNQVSGFEHAKLRVLNATHSTMAYLGHLLSIDTVYDAINIPAIRHFIEQMLAQEVQPSFTVPDNLDFNHYCQSIIKRYQNPEIKHLLSQIAWDGSLKLAERIIPIITANLDKQQPIKHCCYAIAAWMHFVIDKSKNNSEIIDPINEKLNSIGQKCTQNAEHDCALFLALPLFSEALKKQSEFTTQLHQCYQQLCENSPAELLKLLDKNHEQ